MMSPGLRGLAGTMLAGLLLCALGGWASAQPVTACPLLQQAQPAGPAAPALPEEVFFDPFLLQAENRYYAYASNWGYLNVPVATSCDLVHWTRLRNGPIDHEPSLDALPIRPDWVREETSDVVKPDLWAPEVMRLGRRYVMYFSARHKRLATSGGGARECIGVAFSKRPDRYFIPREQPVICDEVPDGAIDPSPFMWRGKLYLAYKTDGNCCQKVTNIVVRPLNGAGTRPVGQPVTLLSSHPDLLGKEDEEGIIEAPTLVKHGQGYVLFYSRGDFHKPFYSVAYATCTTPVTPCGRPSLRGNVILDMKDSGLVGPGHQSVLMSGRRTFMAYHALTGAAGDARRLYLQELYWCADGRPTLSAVEAARCGAAIARLRQTD